MGARASSPAMVAGEDARVPIVCCKDMPFLVTVVWSCNDRSPVMP